MSEQSEVLFVYLGKKGGVTSQALDLMEIAKNNLISTTLLLARDNSDLSEAEKGEHNIIELDISHRLNLLNLFKLISARSKFLHIDSRIMPRVTIFMMPHPWDLWLLRRKNSLIKHSKVVRVIHDATPHDGEYWPRRHSILCRIKSSDSVIFHSTYVKNQTKVDSINRNNLVLPLIYLPKVKSDVKKFDFLFIGRGKKYQGVDRLSEIVDEIETLMPSARVHISLGGQSFLGGGNNVEISDRWLTETEFNELVSSSLVVILPYVSASQSGIIAKALAHGVPVVATDVGGIKEQIRVGLDGEIVGSLEPKSIARVAIKVLSQLDKYSPSNDHDVEIWNRYFEELFVHINGWTNP
jgi:glycosyltransferase involved in cell wall biosynthesis